MNDESGKPLGWGAIPVFAAEGGPAQPPPPPIASAPAVLQELLRLIDAVGAVVIVCNAQGQLDAHLKTMDIHAPGNMGWEARLAWFVQELVRQACLPPINT